MASLAGPKSAASPEERIRYERTWFAILTFAALYSLLTTVFDFGVAFWTFIVGWFCSWAMEHYLKIPGKLLIRLWGTWLVPAVWAALLWLRFTELYHCTVDIGLFVVCFLASIVSIPSARTYLVWLLLDPFDPVYTWAPGFRSFLLYVLCSWVSISICYRLLEGEPLSLAHQHHPPASVALALSGGGYRAALVHAGVLQALDDLQLSPRDLSTVSGGSITGAFYIAGGQPHDLVSAVASGRLNLQRELIYADSIIPMVSGFRDRVSIQANLLEKVLLPKKKLIEVTEGSRRNWVICASDLIRGSAVGILPNGLLVRRAIEANERLGFFNYPEATEDLPSLTNPRSEFSLTGKNNFPNDLSFSHWVAASGAFPVAFNSVSVEVRRRSLLFSGEFPSKYILVDGGVSDNTGLELLLEILKRVATGRKFPVDLASLESRRCTSLRR